ncbi:MAG: methyl-accepting chemotaxis protein [Planctomycetes bacterium]|nr:methyl-accepting chemotaxis protein [Planctomycetota bacterium]
MKSFTVKLAGILVAMLLIPLVVGISGAMAMKTAERTLNANNTMLHDLRSLLAASGQALSDNAVLQEKASATTATIAADQTGILATLREMGDFTLPKAFAVSRLRNALGEAISAERALLLTMNMRHLDLEELRAVRDQQRASIGIAITALQSARETYARLAKDEAEAAAWQALEAALEAWQRNHDAFMAEIDSLDELVDDLVRGGPVFASRSRQAYDTIFQAGRAARLECERIIEDLNLAIVRSAEADVRQAALGQERFQDQVRELDDDSTLAVARAATLRDQILDAQDATVAAVERSSQALADAAGSFRYLIAISAVGVLLVLLLGLYFAWNISQPVRRMARHMHRIAMGDLTADVPAADVRRNDEIGQLARAMQDMIAANRAEIAMANSMAAGDYTRPMPLRSEVDELGRALAAMLQTSNDTLLGVSGAVERVGRGAAAVSEASRSLSLGAQTSAAAVEEIAQSVHHVDAQAKENAQNAQEANTLATASSDAARRGYDAVRELVASMGEIQESGRKIASVAKLIDDIAFQTNLLALNAAVEAARAGRHGRGFSVVADEVRNLSGRSARAARETSAMVEAMTQRMEVGAHLAEKSDSEFREIVDATTRVARIFNAITAASNLQSTAMAQVSQGLSQIDAVIQENTDTAARTASSSLALSRQAEELRTMLGRFQLMTDCRITTCEPTASDRLAAAAAKAETRLLAAPFESGMAGERDGR